NRRRRSQRPILPRRERPRVEDAAAFLDQFPARGCVFRSRICSGDEILRTVRHPRESRRLHWNWLRGEGPLARNVTLRHGPFHDTKDRLARLTIQDVHVSRLGREGHGRNPASVSDDVDESRGSGWIRIPYVMVNRLKVKLVRAGLNI